MTKAAASNTPADASQSAVIVRRILSACRGAKEAPLPLCKRLIAGRARKSLNTDLELLSPAWRDHAIACVYAALMPPARRKRLGAYFTPPHLVDHLVATLEQAGISPAKQRFRDPAAGGAAFIVPLARIKVAAWRRTGVSDKVIVERLQDQLEGIDIDADLVALANALIQAMLMREFRFPAKSAAKVSLVRVGDSLREQCAASTAHEIGNPPYLRLPRARQRALQRQFADIESGRLNLYTMFVRRALDRVAPGRTVAYVVPSSFLGGPEFAAFRQRVLQLADVRTIDVVEKRRDLFLDATQDACFLVLRRRGRKNRGAPPATRCGVLRADGAYEASGSTRLPRDGSPWKLAEARGLTPGSTLADWGYRATIGYLVSNRQPEKLFERRAKGRYPLIWAKAISPEGDFDFERSGLFREKLWASAPADAPYLVRQPCVALQRISSRGQKRRLNAAAIPKSFLRTHKAVIGENHVIFLVPASANAVSPELLAQALNTPTASAQFDRISGSTSISARLLETMALPKPPAKPRRALRR